MCVNPVSPAFGLPPRPVAPSSRISPPAPVGCAGKRRDRGRMVVRLDLDRVGNRSRCTAAKRPSAWAKKRAPSLPSITAALSRVRRQGELRRQRMRVLDHREQRLFLRLAVDRPARVEHLVPAMLGIGLREHHQFGIGRIASEFGVARGQIFDFVRRQGQAEARIGRTAVRPAASSPRSMRSSGAGRAGAEQSLRLVERGRAPTASSDRAARARACAQPSLSRDRRAVDVEGDAALDALHGKAAAAQDVGGLRRPRRNRAEARHDPQARALRCAAGRARSTLHRRSLIERARVRLRRDEIHVPGRSRTRQPGATRPNSRFSRSRRNGDRAG